MWLKLASATFTTNLGTMSSLSNSISIRYTASGFSPVTGSVSKDAASASLVLNLLSNWTCDSTPTVSVTGANKGSISYSAGKLTIPITPSSGSTFGASGVSSINVTVTGAVVNIPDSGEGTEPTPPSGGDTPTVQHPYASGATMPSDGIITADMTVVLDHTWLNGTDTTLLDNQDESAGTTSTNYFCSYLPIDITGYTKLDLTANTENAAYYQFFTTDGSYKLTGARIKVDKGISVTEQSIPSKAKYLVVAHHRIKDDGLTYSYFPTTLKIYK